jgi:ribosomal protein L37AE/L43A
LDKEELLAKIQRKTKVEGRTSLYNPLLQKPTSLYPVGPGSYPGGLGGYAYIGPPADFGGSYGCYEDSAGRKQIGVKSSKLFSMWDGSPMQLKGELSAPEREALLTQLDEASEDHKCPHCRSELAISVAAECEGSVHCPHCGTAMEGAAEKIKLCVSKLKEKNMENDKKNISATARKIAAAALTQASEDLAKEAMKFENPQEQTEQGKDIAKEAMKVEPPMDNAQQPNLKPKASELIDPQVKPKMEHPMKELEKSNASVTAPPAAPAVAAEDEEEKKKKAKAEEDEKKAKAASEEEEKAKKMKAEEEEKAKKMKAEEDEKKAKSSLEKAERIKKALASYKEKRKARLSASKGKFDAATTAKLKKELRVMAALEPEKFAEVRKNSKLAAICAEVEKVVVPKDKRAQVRAELKALAAEDAKAHEDAVRELEFVAPEILMEDDMGGHAKSAEDEERAKAEEAAKHAQGSESEEDKKKRMAEESLKNAPNPTPPMKEPAKLPIPSDAPGAEYSASAEEEEKKMKAEEEEWMKSMSMKTEFLANLETIKGDKIEMSLNDSNPENPFWNLTVDSEPVGRIHLADQENVDQIKASFVSESYAENVGKAISEMGLKKVLTHVKAKLYAHRLDDKSVLARIRDQAKVVAKAEMTDKILSLRKDFMRAVSLAMVASNKNFYQEEARHALKGGLFNALVQAGLTDEHAVWAIEAGFEDAPQYFDFVMDKAQEIMDMPKEARESLEKTIMSSGKIEVAKAVNPEDETLAQRLTRASVQAVAMGSTVSGENREVIRNQMGLNPNRR